MTKEHILATIRRRARQLGRVPTQEEMHRAGVPRSQVLRFFESHGDASRHAGLHPSGAGYRVTTDALLLDWAAVARQLGALPKRSQYTRHGRYDSGGFQGPAGRWERWRNVPAAFRQFARENASVGSEWADVLAMIAAHLQQPKTRGSRPQSAPPKSDFQAETAEEKPQEIPSIEIPPIKEKRLVNRRALYGPLLLLPGMAHEPMDETGVIFLFGVIAHRLGYMVLRTHQAFPDCEALREVQPGCWQRVTIEFEFESRNFLKHKHPADECDMIVCWRHNWPECPRTLEVVELARVVKKLGAGGKSFVPERNH